MKGISHPVWVEGSMGAEVPTMFYVLFPSEAIVNSICDQMCDDTPYMCWRGWVASAFRC